uniref:Aminotransferase-like plant mobile domain-containing protein n=1 Tax=Oryza rufipogon TaxID=4529 RepID=A0A0E0Q5Z8_ORYRU
MCLLKPVLFNDSGTFDVPRHTATLAQQFITSRTKRWLEDQPMQLRLEISPNDKLMLWARMLMVNPYDRTYLKKAGVLRGIMASIYKCKIDPSLVAAFLTYWNVDGHTLLTSQGEMGYPLHTMYDAMGIPISGRLYEEFIPLSSTVRGHVQTLHNIYVEECPLQLNEGPGIVTIATWVNHFFGDHPVPFQSFLPDGFADPKEPLYEGPNFRVEIRNGRPTGIMCGLEMTYVHTYLLVVYRAAFIASWLCTYCVPVEEGNFIRPEVFTMVVEIAQGSRQAIGVTSMAFLYHALDNVYHQVAARQASASDCSSFVPGHFIMGWFASFWRGVPTSATFSCPVMNPPFIIDFRDYESMDIKSAHSLFWDFNDAGTTLRSLDFLGRSSIRFPTSDQEVELFDDCSPKAHRAISMAAVDFLEVQEVGWAHLSKEQPTLSRSLLSTRRRALKPRSKTTSPLPTSSANPTEIVRVGPDRSGKDIEKIRACIANPDNVTTHVSVQASQQELLLLPPRNETALNSSAMTHIDPYSEGLAIPHDDTGTLPTDLLTGDFSDVATLLEGGANPETSLCLDSPIFPGATQKDNVNSHLSEDDETRTEACADTGKGGTSHHASLTGVEELSNESKKLSMDVEQIVAQIPKAPNGDSGAGENSQFKEFHGNNPSEIKAFQELLKQRPIQKDIVLKEISINLDLWSNFFSKPPPEIIRLMEGLRVLKGALSEEAPLPTTKIDHHIDMLRTAQDKVESSCVALAALTSQYNVERAVEEGNKRECSRQAQKIKAKIAMLQAELQQVEDDYSRAQCHQDVVIENLNSHLERHHQAKNRGSEIAAQLEQASVRQKSLQNIVVFTKSDEFGLSQYVYNIFDFFIGCSLDE